MGKEVHLFNESPIPAVYRFLPSVNTIEQQIDPALPFDAAIVLDCGISIVSAILPPGSFKHRC
jgi:bifunctional oligoribonuclease and PAP phosphatase NrnA